MAADGEGFIRVCTYVSRLAGAPGGAAAGGGSAGPATQAAQGLTLNRFHVGGAAAGAGAAPAPVSVRALYQLTELQEGLLVACAADGAVRVWRGHAARGTQRLAAAWQAVLVPGAGGAPVQPSSYCWAPSQGTLFAAGGRAAGRIYCWDLRRESCSTQLGAAGGGASAGEEGPGWWAAEVGGTAPCIRGGFPVLPKSPCSSTWSLPPFLTPACSSFPSRLPAAEPPVDHLGVSVHSPALFAADSEGLVRVYDLRSGAVAGTAQHLRSRLAGMAVEPGGTPHQLVLSYPSGHLSFLDCRMLGGAGGGPAATGIGAAAAAQRLETGLWKSFEAHSKGVLSAMCAHGVAPLLATATTSQVVKLWSTRGEQVGVVRAHTSFLSQRIGPITCLAFGPHDLHLASGGGDSIVAVYQVEAGSRAAPGPPPPPSPPRPPRPAAPK